MFYDPSLKPGLPPKPTVSPAIELEPWRNVLLGAAELIDRYGHCKQTMYHENSMCLFGAIFTARSQYWNASVHEAIDALCKVTHVTNENALITWNDQPERTKEEVINTLRDAASI